MIPDVGMFLTSMRETFSRSCSPRTPEPALVMDEGDNIKGYTQLGRDTQVMMQSDLFTAAMSSPPAIPLWILLVGPPRRRR